MKKGIILIVVVLLIAGCNKTDSENLSTAEKLKIEAENYVLENEENYRITYHKEASVQGFAPESAGVNNFNPNIVISGNTGGLKKFGYFFDCWNTMIDGRGEDFPFSAEVSIDRDMDLYPKWKPYNINYLNDQITSGNNDEIDRILQSGLDPAIKDDSTNLNPLILAADAGNGELVEKILNSGVDINSVFYSSTAVFEAIINLNFELVDYLLDNGADINKGSWLEGETAAMVLIINLNDKNNRIPYDRNTTVKMLEKIIDNGHDLDAGAWYGNPLYESIVNNDFEITELLLENGADPYYIQSESKMSLIELAYEENQELGELLQRYAEY